MIFWKIRLFGGETFTQKDFPNDKIVFWNGLYGVPSHVLWYAALDKTEELNVGDIFRFGIYKVGGKFQWDDDYKIQKINYDLKQQKYRIFATALIDNVLETVRMVKHIIWSNNKQQPLKGSQVIRNIVKSREFKGIVGNNKKYPIFSNTTERVGYTQASFDKNTRYIDIITQICIENGWEFYIRGNGMFLMDIIHLPNKHTIKKKLKADHRKLVNTDEFTSVERVGTLAEPGTMYGDYGRIIWVRYLLGGNVGGTMNLMIDRRPQARLSEKEFIHTLNGLAWELGQQRLNRNYGQENIVLGETFGSYNKDHRDKYTAPRFSADNKTFSRDLDKQIFNTNYKPNDTAFLNVRDAKKTTPYAGDGVGMLFPQGKSKQLLLTPKGDREFSVLGPNYFGGGDEVPRRDNEEDFRLQLPNRSAMIWYHDGEAIFSPYTNMKIVPGGIRSDQLTEPQNSPEVNVDSEGGEITIKMGTNEVVISNSGIEIKGTKIDGLKPTLKIENGKIKVQGKMQVFGIIDAITVKGQTVMNAGGPMAAKLKPG